MVIPGRDPRLRIAFQLFDAPMGGPLELFRGQFREPPLYEIQPRGTGGREMQRESRVFHQLALNRGRCVGRIVVQHEMNREVRGDRRVEAARGARSGQPGSYGRR